MIEAEAHRVLADTVAVGSHGYGRTVGIVVGSAATWLIHNAACSVLVARATATQPFPASIVVGLDGSDASLQALESAREIAARVGAPLHVVHVLDGRFPAAGFSANWVWTKRSKRSGPTGRPRTDSRPTPGRPTSWSSEAAACTASGRSGA